MCVDYRKLNRITLADLEPMTTADDLFQKMSTAKYFSMLDRTKGFWVVEMNKVYKENCIRYTRWTLRIFKDAFWSKKLQCHSRYVLKKSTRRYSYCIILRIYYLA